MKRILTIKGGGMRGIISCGALIGIEKRAGRPIRELVDMIGGTSTGALQAAALAAGVPAREIMRFYTERASGEIFGGRMSAISLVASGHRYDTDAVARVLREALGPAAQWTLNDAPVRLFLAAMHVSKQPLYFVADRPRNAKTTGFVSLVDAAVASAAAPLYFHSWYVSPLPPGTRGPFGDELIGHCFDGGVGTAGNPVYECCVEAFCFDDFDPADTMVMSIGTGYHPGGRQVNAPASLIPTITWTVDTLVGAPLDKQAQQVNRHWPGILLDYDWPLARVIDMADASDGAIAEMLRIAAIAQADLVRETPGADLYYNKR